MVSINPLRQFVNVVNSTVDKWTGLTDYDVNLIRLVTDTQSLSAHHKRYYLNGVDPVKGTFTFYNMQIMDATSGRHTITNVVPLDKWSLNIQSKQPTTAMQREQAAKQLAAKVNQAIIAHFGPGSKSTLDSVYNWPQNNHETVIVFSTEVPYESEFFRELHPQIDIMNNTVKKIEQYCQSLTLDAHVESYEESVRDLNDRMTALRSKITRYVELAMARYET